jgi:hypothetical protein
MMEVDDDGGHGGAGRGPDPQCGERGLGPSMEFFGAKVKAITRCGRGVAKRLKAKGSEPARCSGPFSALGRK